MLDDSKGSRKRGKRVLEIFKGPKTLLGSKTLFPLTLILSLDETRIALGDLFVNVVLLPFLATFISR